MLPGARGPSCHRPPGEGLSWHPDPQAHRREQADSKISHTKKRPHSGALPPPRGLPRGNRPALSLRAFTPSFPGWESAESGVRWSLRLSPKPLGAPRQSPRDCRCPEESEAEESRRPSVGGQSPHGVLRWQRLLWTHAGPAS